MLVRITLRIGLGSDGTFSRGSARGAVPVLGVCTGIDPVAASGIFAITLWHMLVFDAPVSINSRHGMGGGTACPWALNAAARALDTPTNAVMKGPWGVI